MALIKAPLVKLAELIIPQGKPAPELEARINALGFNPWHALADHQPLGNVMRARRKAYQMSSKYRHTANGREIVEPKSIDEIPD